MALSRRRSAVVDAFALVVFVAVGVATHGASFGAFARDAACILGAWFAVAAVVGLYRRGGWRRLGATWLAGVSAGVLVRAAVVGHLDLVFWAVALAFTGLFVSLGHVGGLALSRMRDDSRTDIAAREDARHRRPDGETAA